MVLTIICFLIGAALAMRFKVLIVVPVVGLALVGTAVVGIAHGDPIESLVLTMILIATILELGYLAGLVSRHALVAGGMAKAPAIGPHDRFMRDNYPDSSAASMTPVANGGPTLGAWRLRRSRWSPAGRRV